MESRRVAEIMELARDVRRRRLDDERRERWRDMSAGPCDTSETVERARLEIESGFRDRMY
jgi:hypothetical protein